MRNLSPRKWLALTPTARRLLWALLAVEAVMVVLHIVTQRPAAPRFAWRMFDLSTEQALGAAFSSWQTLAVAVLAFLNGLHVVHKRVWGKTYWWLLAALFVFLSADEYFTIHESFAEHVGQGGQVLIYTAGGALLAGFMVAAYWKGLRGESGPVVVLVAGLVVTAIGGLLIDYVQCRRGLAHTFEFLNQNFGSLIPGLLNSCEGTYPYEEFFEMAGISVVLAGFVTYAQGRLSADAWRRASRALWASGAVVAALFVGSIWIAPGVEARLLAEPVAVEYADGALSLVGYRVTPRVAQPGERVTVRLYWRANQRLPVYYYESAHLVTHPEVASLSQDDLRIGGWLGWRTDTWLPGVVMRDTIRLELPPDAPTPASYWLALRVFEWHGHEYRISFLDTEDVLPSHSERPLLEPDTVIVFSLPAPGDGPDAPPPTTSDYAFADGFRLAGYALPEEASAGGTARLGFWWETSGDVGVDLMQFIHFVNVDSGELFGFDQPPFGGRFPTADWPQGTSAQDSVEIALPEEMPPGEYRVLTGMYVLETGERRAASDETGQPLPDYAITLGTVSVGP